MNDHDFQEPQNKHLNAMLTFVGLLPMVYFIPPWIIEHITSDNRIVTVLTVGVIVPSIAYIFLPTCYWVFKKLK